MADRGTEVQFLEAAHAKLQDYILTMRSGLGKKIATQGLQRLEKRLEQLRSKEHSVAHKEFDPEAITDQKRAWLEAQELARGEQQLASWPQHLIDHFFVVGLPPDIEVTQIAGDLLGKWMIILGSQRGFLLMEYLPNFPGLL
ncbi:hypothetical protein DUNSADRAFT_1641 [Dunaliella salina]|uniref:Uncharacterized protein n=1 Tax=Dunaliella salina TaxID=3046 RepID=A0ABQ7GWW9_DUNSA|nr:hypothetical protein DUNSADRAFT_1641 [Dunaliella salina]|eukprot:KAF5839096.1 hypothetical protein DUNSADRAFT_1641 [Dunaliella salina]